jgi:3-oxoacyl-[acyl-carrier protein] reductase
VNGCNHSSRIFITGASGGIGFAVARRFAATGAKIILHAHRNVAAVNELCETIQHSGGTAGVVSADFLQSDAAENLYRHIFDMIDGIDILVNAAGLDLMLPSVVSLPFEKKLQQILQTDVFTPIRLSKMIGERMKQQGHGTIFFFGWNGVDYGWRGDTAQLYGAAKGALLGFSRSLAEDLAPNVLVRCLSLGWIKTRWGEKLSDEIERRYAADSRRNRWGTPEEVAAVVEFLASKESEYIDGIGLRLDGEKTACCLAGTPAFG